MPPREVRRSRPQSCTHLAGQSRLVVSRLVPRIGSTSLQVSVKPSLAWAHGEKRCPLPLAHIRSYPDDLAPSKTALAASVAFPVSTASEIGSPD